MGPITERQFSKCLKQLHLLDFCKKQSAIQLLFKAYWSMSGGESPYVPPVPGHGQFLDQISVKTYVGTGSFYCEMCPRKILKVLNYN